MRTRRKWILGLALAIGAIALAACGSDEGTDTAGADATPADAAPAAKEKGIPAALSANRAEGSQILEEGQLEPKLAELEGHPIVVNQWASWCEPCRAEFPYFRDSAESHADEIAFVGIDMQDSRDAAESFLAELPVPYPSIFDPNAAQIASLGGGVVSPTTVFIDADGEVVNVFQGSYATRDQLELDIETHLLG
jgi:cytochrome c biogenesis protein CcmG/thiol:disulfide interchange protein DsbE